MKRPSSFDPRIAAFLDREAGRSSPDYLDDILRVTARARQRPAWTSLERWLRVDIAANRSVFGRPIPWRPLGVLIALALLLAALVAVTVGSRPRLPEPLGRAANGLVAYGVGGDIVAVDPATGTSSVIVGGPTNDETPDFSRDGSRFVFARETATPDRWVLVVADADGTDQRTLTPPGYPEWNVWSPDSTRVAVVDVAPAVPTLSIFALDGSAPQILDLDGMKAERVAWRPDGTGLVFRGVGPGLHGLYTVNVDGSGLRPILPPTSIETDWMEMSLSPDGTRVAYTKWVVDRPFIRVVEIASGVDRELAFAGHGETTADGWARWSPDGTQLVFTRLDVPANHLAVGPAAGGVVVEMGPGLQSFTDGAQAEFAPDGSKVIARYGFDASTWILDVSGGPGTKLADDISALASWQRRAP